MIRTNEDLVEAIKTVVNYNWKDELRDFEECLDPANGNSPEGHILLTLHDLSVWIWGEDEPPLPRWENGRLVRPTS